MKDEGATRGQHPMMPFESRATLSPCQNWCEPSPRSCFSTWAIHPWMESQRCSIDSSSLALSLEEPEAPLIDYANQGAVALDLRATIPGRDPVGGAYLHFGIQAAVVSLGRIFASYHLDFAGEFIFSDVCAGVWTFAYLGTLR